MFILYRNLHMCAGGRGGRKGVTEAPLLLGIFWVV
jgi:hypothetical protein